MTVVTDITKLSQTASLNGPDGAVDPPNVLDDQDRYLGSFIAMLRDGVGFTAGALTNPTGALGFTPVRQGTGPGQGTNVVSIGWSASLGKLLASVDNNAFGNVWPIDADAALALRSGGVNTGTRMQFTWTDPGAGGGYAWCGDGAASQFVRPLSGMTVGRATTAGSADSTGYASNAGMVNSIGPWRYTNLNYNPPYLWATAGAPSDNFLVQPANLSVAYATSAGSAGSAPANGGTADNANALLGQGSAYWINNGSTAVRNLRNNGTAQLLAALSGFGDTWWATNPSDARLKKDIALTTQDSLSQIARLVFRQFRFIDNLPWKAGKDDPEEHPDTFMIDDGHLHKLGVIAQEAELIEPEWIGNEGAYKQINQLAMLMSAMHAIQQLRTMMTELANLVKA